MEIEAIPVQSIPEDRLDEQPAFFTPPPLPSDSEDTLKEYPVRSVSGE
jgi:hypothetical protein